MNNLIYDDTIVTNPPTPRETVHPPPASRWFFNFWFPFVFLLSHLIFVLIFIFYIFYCIFLLVCFSRSGFVFGSAPVTPTAAALKTSPPSPPTMPFALWPYFPVSSLPHHRRHHQPLFPLSSPTTKTNRQPQTQRTPNKIQKKRSQTFTIPLISNLETHAHETKVEGHDSRLDSRFSGDDDRNDGIHSLYYVVVPSLWWMRELWCRE